MSQDKLMALIQSLLPQPVSRLDSLEGEIIVGGDPGEVVVQILDDEIRIGEYAVQWNGPCTSEIVPRKMESVYSNESAEAQISEHLKPLIQKIRQRRRAKYRRCQRCDEINPPEWMHDQETCQSCSERHLGVVYQAVLAGTEEFDVLKRCIKTRARNSRPGLTRRQIRRGPGVA